MTTRQNHREKTLIQVVQSGDKVTLDYYVDVVAEDGKARKSLAHRRVIVTVPEALRRDQMATLALRMATHIVHTQRGNGTLRRGLPWHEVGMDFQPVPPGGGEGGEMAGQADMIDRSGDVIEAAVALPSASAPPPPGEAVRRSRSASAVDLPRS